MTGNNLVLHKVCALVGNCHRVVCVQGIHSDPAISLAKTTTTKTVEPNSADTLQDSAVEMDDLQFRGVYCRIVNSQIVTESMIIALLV